MEWIVSLCVTAAAASLALALWFWKEAAGVKRAANIKQEHEQWDHRMETVSEVHRVLSDILKKMDQLSPSLDRVSQGIDKVPVLIDGLQDMCKASAAQTDVLAKAVETLQVSIDGSSRASGEEEEDDLERRRAIQQEVRELVRKGIPEKDAQARVLERSLYEGIKLR